MTTLTASQLLGTYADGRTGPARLIDALGAGARRLLAAHQRRLLARRLGGMPDYLLRDIGLTAADLDNLDRVL